MSESGIGRNGAGAPGKAAPESGEAFERLKDLLREMFQLDRGDLDFGLYRVMAMKAGEIELFLERDLLPQAKEALAGVADEARARIEAELDATVAQLETLNAPVEDNEKVLDLRARLAEARADEQAEADVYGHLADFFGRYYREGDFMSLRRYAGAGRPTYLIPWDGEEVKLHWANADQYYIKTTENYAAYAFVAGEARRRVRFEIAAATTARDNVKEAAGRQRRFVPANGAAAVMLDGDGLAVRFEHRPLTQAEKKRWPGAGARQQDRIDATTAERIPAAAERLEPGWRALLTAPAPTDADPGRTLLARHLARYTARNTFDYFIHKDLGGFLRRELDLYLKTEVLNVDDLSTGDADRTRRALARMRAVRRVGEKIVAFLAQLEDFQKRLWLKKKFVLETRWCATLDRVPRALHPEIAANEAQRREWADLFAIDEVDGAGGNRLLEEAPAPFAGEADDGGPTAVALLEAHPHLVLDTRHFDADFTDRLLSALSDAGPLDDGTDGLLVHGENFQALNLLRTRYAGQVGCVYIDPPYNTDASAILYKNDYKDSSWLSLMSDRLSLAHDCLTNEGIVCVAIDDEEVSLLRLVMERIFEKELGIVPVRSNPAGRKSRGQFSPTHEYALFFGKENSVPGTLNKTEKELARYPHIDEDGRFAWNNLIRHGSGDRRQDRPTMFYPIYVGNDDSLRVPALQWDSSKQQYNVLEDPEEGETTVWPIKDEDGTLIEKRWHRGPNAVSGNPSDYRVRRNGESSNSGISIDFKIRIDLRSMPKTWWDDKRYASANLGPKVLKDMFGEKEFDFSKAVRLVEDSLRAAGCTSHSVVLDYFAGSGTTGHAVIGLNREDGGARKYVLVEMGDHFDAVLLPRLKKVVHSPDWRNGAPTARDEGVSQLVKIARLESYEDTLDGLVATPPDGDLMAANAARDPAMVEDYRLRYALAEETASSPCLLGRHFADPFAYTLSVARDGQRRDQPVDLPETFNLLLGLRVESRRRIDGVLAIAGADPQGRRCLVLWRDLGRTDDEALNAWFAARRADLPAPLDLVYANGDHTLNAIRGKDETWTAEPVEPLFRRLMFEEDEG